MRKYFFLGASILLTLALGVPRSEAVEKSRFATHIRANAQYALPPLAALEKGFWKEEGLEVTWVPFDSATTMNHAVAAGEIDLGTHGVAGGIQAIATGVPMVIVADPGITTEFFFWVVRESRLKEPRDLKGAKIGATRFGSDTHLYSLAVVRALGLEKDVRFLAMGGVPAQIAGLKAGAVDVITLSFFSVASLKVKGEVRELLKVDDFLVKGLGSQIIYAHPDFLKRKPEVVRKVVRGFLQGGNFIMKNPEWAVERMKKELRQSEEAARAIHPRLRYDTDGKIDVSKIENVINFFTEYGILTKEKAPRVEKTYARGFSD